MKTPDLIFIGIRGSVVALNRSTGKKVWATHLKGVGFVNVVLEDQTVIASCYGEVFCLDPLTGNGLWHNPLRGFGVGLTTIATHQNPGNGSRLVLAEQRRREQAAADEGGSVAAVS